jgi:hypothetical protein
MRLLVEPIISIASVAEHTHVIDSILMYNAALVCSSESAVAMHRVALRCVALTVLPPWRQDSLLLAPTFLHASGFDHG